MKAGDRARSPKPVVSARDRLLDAVQSLLIERNSLDVTINEIGTRANANPALIAYHFGSREGLMVELVRRDAREALAEVEHLLLTPITPLERIARHIRGVVWVFFKKPYLTPLFHRLLAHGTNAASEVVMREVVLPLSAARGRMFEEAMADGSIREIDPVMIEFALNGACEHFFASAAKTRTLCAVETIDSEVCDRFAKSTVDLLLNGLVQRDPVASTSRRSRSTGLPRRRGGKSKTRGHSPV
jgi:TetR/AcrR family transcriptional regulator